MSGLSNLYCLLGYSCNNDCLFCATGGNHKPDLATREVRDFMEQHLSYGETVQLTGGEPTIRSDIIDILSFAHHSFGAPIAMLTNARRFCDREFAHEMADSGLSDVCASLYSHKRSLHDSLTCRKGSFAETVAGIKNLESLGVRVQVRTLITRPTFTDMPYMVDFIASQFKNVQISISAMDVVENAYRNRSTMVVRLSEAAPYVEESIEVTWNYGIRISVIDFPMCLLRPHYRTAVVPRNRMHSSVKYRSPRTVQFNRDQACTVGSHDKCVSCFLRDTCPGTWQSYISIYGDSELRPQQ